MPDLRPDPEALLRQAEADGRGRLKVFLGYAPGVGKSFRLFDEGRRRHERGEDVVVAPWLRSSTRTSRRVVRNSRPCRCSRPPDGERSAWTPCWPGIRPSAWSTISPATTRLEPRAEALSGRRSAHRRRHFGADLDQPRGDRRAAAVHRTALRAPQRRDGAAILHRQRRRDRRCRRARRPFAARGDRRLGRAGHRPGGVARARVAARGRCRPAAARRLPSRQSRRRVVGHAGAYPRLHDAPCQCGRDARQRPAQRRSLPRRAVRRLREPAEPHGGGSVGARAQRHAGARTSMPTSRSSTATIRSPPSSSSPVSATSRSCTSATTSGARGRPASPGSLLDRLIRRAEGLDVLRLPALTP